MAGTITVKLYDLLKSIGVDVSQQSGSNVKTLATKNKSSATKPGLLAGERDTGGNFATVLDIFKKEAQYIDGMNDVEQMAFLNNIMDYKEFGGSSIKNTEGIKLLDEAKNLTDETGDLQTSIKNLQSTAKTMKEDAEKGLKSAEDDLKTFLETGGNPLNKKDKKFLGGSMQEEGQIRTGVREFLKKEFKNGRINLDETDAQRILKYSPMSEDDPILVFKKIYGDEAYKKAGSFPGAFDVGESYDHYESIFRSKMGDDILKVKDKKYVGDGKLVLTKQEEVVTPTPDEDMPFAKGGRASFAGGKVVDEIVLMLTKKEPMEAMKEINKVIGKKGKYKNLTQKDIDRIVDQTNDHIFQRDPDNLYVEDRPMFKQKKEPDTQVFKDSEGGIKGITMGGDAEFKKAMSEAMEEGIRESENMKRIGLDPSKKGDFDKYEKMKADGKLEKNVTGLADMSESETLMKKYPGMPKELAEQIAKDPDPARKAQVVAMVEQTFELSKQGKSGDEIIDIFKKGTDRTEQAGGGITKLRNGYSDGNIVYDGEGPIQFDLPFGEPMFTMKMNGKLFGIYKNKNGSHLSVPLGKDGKVNYAKGGRAGYYGGGMTNMIEPDLSDIGHGSDALMGRTRLAAPGSQATTSTGLNYLLGEDNDNVRIPFNEGLLVPPKKPYTEEMFQDDSMTLLKGMYGTGKDSNEFLYNEIIKKGNKLRERGVERETVIEIIRNNKDKIDMILKQQTTSPKSLAGLANGGRIGFAGGGADMGTVDAKDSKGNVTRAATAKSVNVSPSGQVTTSRTKGPDGPDYSAVGPDSVYAQNVVNQMQEPSFNTQAIDAIDKANTLNKFYNFGNTLNPLALFKSNPYAFAATGIFSLAERNRLKKLRDEQKNSLQPLEIDSKKKFEDLVKTVGYESGINSEADALYNDYRNEVGLNINPKTINARTDNFFNSIDGNTQYDYNISNSDVKDLFTGDSTKNLTVSNMGDILESRRVTPSGVTSFDVPQPFGDPQSLSVQPYADGGIAGLRQGYAGGNIVDKGRRGFLKFLGGTAAGVVALKAGLVKLLGKESGAISKKAIDEVIIDGGSGAPAWLQPLVNKALREGTDISKQAIKDGQVVKSLDTPTGKVDVYYDTRTGEIDIDYIGGNTALGESVNMRYVPGVADEGTKGVKPADEFEAVERVPENTMFGVDDYELTMGENAVSDVKDLYSDTSELATLGGQKPLIKDISETIKKKKVLKQMDTDPTEFATEGYSTGQYYDPT